MRQAVKIAGRRTAIGKSRKDTIRNHRSDEKAAAVVRELMRQTEGKPDLVQIDDVLLDCAILDSSAGLNMARAISLRTGLPVEVPTQTVNRFCPGGLQTIATTCERLN